MYPWHEFENYFYKMAAIYPMGQWVKYWFADILLQRVGASEITKIVKYDLLLFGNIYMRVFW